MIKRFVNKTRRLRGWEYNGKTELILRIRDFIFLLFTVRKKTPFIWSSADVSKWKIDYYFSTDLQVKLELSWVACKCVGRGFSKCILFRYNMIYVYITWRILYAIWFIWFYIIWQFRFLFFFSSQNHKFNTKTKT